MKSYVVTKSLCKHDVSEWIAVGEAKSLIQFYVKAMMNDPKSFFIRADRKFMRVTYPDGDRYFIFEME